MADKQTKIGRVLVLAAAVLWSMSALFSKAPTFADWPEESRPILLVFWRALFATVVILTLVRRPKFSWKMVPMLIAFAMMNYAFITAMVRAEAAAVIWLQMTSPAWIFLGSAFIFREKVIRRDWTMLAFSMLGVAVILVFSGQQESISVLLLGLLSGVTYACVVLSLRALRDYDSAWLIALNHMVTTLVFLPFVVSQGVLPSATQLIVLLLFGTLQMGVPYVVFALGVKRIGGHEASGIGLIEPILVPLWVFLAWRHESDYQPPQWWTLVGGAMILVGLLIRYIGPIRRSDLSTEKNEVE